MSDAPDLTLAPTRETYDAFQDAFERLNHRLFEHRLPNALITLQRRARSYGYFAAKRMRRSDGARAHEIALNPAHFKDRAASETLATLVHEMVHLWQAEFGAPGRGGYHNREWADAMKRIGLRPSATGAPGGRETGDRMSQYVRPGGAFERAARELIAGGFRIEWCDAPRRAAYSGNAAAPRQAAASGVRRKFTCPACGQNAWAKPGAALRCGLDGEAMWAAG